MDTEKQFIVFSVSRASLLDLFGFSPEQVESLTDEDMQRIAENVRHGYDFLEDEFGETVRFIARLILAEKRQHDPED